VLTYPRPFSRGSKGFSGTAGFPSAQFVNQVRLILTAHGTPRLQTLKHRIYQTPRHMACVLSGNESVRQMVRHAMTIPYRLPNQPLRASLRNMNRDML
jgi:hypothetical protein